MTDITQRLTEIRKTLPDNPKAEDTAWLIAELQQRIVTQQVAENNIAAARDFPLNYRIWLEEENARLRRALEEIAEYKFVAHGSQTLQGIAQQALNGDANA